LGNELKIGILNYDAGNLRSVETALAYLGSEYLVSNKPEELTKCDKLIFPGVGEARSSMNNLKKYGLDLLLKDFYKKGNPILGICMGCQIVLDSSEERNTDCLGLIKGTSREFSHSMDLKIPHMGWNQVGLTNKHYIFNDIPDKSSFYFVHSYYPDLHSSDIEVGVTEYGIRFSSAFSLDNLIAVQFHPEKSGPHGLKLLDNFIKPGRKQVSCSAMRPKPGRKQVSCSAVSRTGGACTEERSQRPKGVN
jgi:imidazole glycerol-phosphate synthase subunit HisH